MLYFMSEVFRNFYVGLEPAPAVVPESAPDAAGQWITARQRIAAGQWTAAGPPVAALSLDRENGCGRAVDQTGMASI